MLSKNKRIMSLISSSIDAALLIVAYLLANWMRFRCLPFLEEGGAGDRPQPAGHPWLGGLRGGYGADLLGVRPL